jgi:hypothetical protein
VAAAAVAAVPAADKEHKHNIQKNMLSYQLITLTDISKRNNDFGNHRLPEVLVSTHTSHVSAGRGQPGGSSPSNTISCCVDKPKLFA